MTPKVFGDSAAGMLSCLQGTRSPLAFGNGLKLGNSFWGTQKLSAKNHDLPARPRRGAQRRATPARCSQHGALSVSREPRRADDASTAQSSFQPPPRRIPPTTPRPGTRGRHRVLRGAAGRAQHRGAQAAASGAQRVPSPRPRPAPARPAEGGGGGGGLWAALHRPGLTAQRWALPPPARPRAARPGRRSSAASAAAPAPAPARPPARRAAGPATTLARAALSAPSAGAAPARSPPRPERGHAPRTRSARRSCAALAWARVPGGSAGFVRERARSGTGHGAERSGQPDGGRAFPGT